MFCRLIHSLGDRLTRSPVDELYVAHGPVPNVEVGDHGAGGRAVDLLLLDRDVPAGREGDFQQKLCGDLQCREVFVDVVDVGESSIL